MRGLPAMRPESFYVLVAVMLLALLAQAGSAQETKPVGAMTVHDFAAKWMMQQDDIADTGFYAQANADLLASADRRPRIVLMGDSVTYHWAARPAASHGKESGASRPICRRPCRRSPPIRRPRIPAPVPPALPARWIRFSGEHPGSPAFPRPCCRRRGRSGVSGAAPEQGSGSGAAVAPPSISPRSR